MTFRRAEGQVWANINQTYMQLNFQW